MAAQPELVIPILSLVAMVAVITGVVAQRMSSAVKDGAGEHRDDALAKLDERIARLENAVDVIGVEIERVGESQRFLTKVLVEQRKP